MDREIKLVRTFAIIGFCNGVFVSGLNYFLEWRGLHGGPVAEVVVLILFPAITMLWEYTGGNALLIFYLFLASTGNGVLYGSIGLIVAIAIESWRQHSARRAPSRL